VLPILSALQKTGSLDLLRKSSSAMKETQGSCRPPWDGGITWQKDDNGKHFIASSNQGIGSSIWWPSKDHPADEVDSMLISVTVPEDLMNVSNGRLRKVEKNGKKRTYHWFVSNPINDYGVNINIGDYVHFSEKYRAKREFWIWITMSCGIIWKRPKCSLRCK
jgi:aminopeptidase N